VKVTTSGSVQQDSAKRQNRGPDNSTGEGVLKAEQVQKEEQHERGAGGTFWLNRYIADYGIRKTK